MNKQTLLILAAAGLAIGLPAQATTNIGVSIGIQSPGQYGRIDIDNYPQPRLVAPQPIIYAPSPVAVHQRPIYLYVPPAHQAQWGRYCGGYRACGQPVYFVQEAWVRDQYQSEQAHRHGHKKAKRQDHHEPGAKRGRGHDKHGD